MTRRDLLRLSAGALGLAVAACDREEPVEAPPEPSPTPAAPPVRVWTPETIGELVPVTPARKSAVPEPVPHLPQYDGALATLGAVVDRWATDPAVPWCIAHGLLARGPELRLADGREAVPALFETWAEPHEVAGRTLWGFPKERGGVRIEAHSDLLLKNLAEVGVPADAHFPGPGGATVAIADLWRWTLLKTFLVAETNHSSFSSPNDTPWNLQGLALWAPEPELQWKAVDGTPMDLDFLTGFVCAVLLQESAFLYEAKKRDQKFQRAGQALFNYACGGAHLLQGATYAVARGFGSAKDRKVLESQVDLWFWRLPGELALYDEVGQRNPAQVDRLLAQRLKFLGHFLESMAKLQAFGLYTSDRGKALMLEGAAQNLTLTVAALQKRGVFDRMDRLRTEDEQLWLDLVGDSCHAVRGLELVLGRQKLWW